MHWRQLDEPLPGLYMGKCKCGRSPGLFHAKAENITSCVCWLLPFPHGIPQFHLNGVMQHDKIGIFMILYGI